MQYSAGGPRGCSIYQNDDKITSERSSIISEKPRDNYFLSPPKDDWKDTVTELDSDSEADDDRQNSAPLQILVNDRGPQA